MGWTFSPEGLVELLPVSRWKDDEADKLVCEIQIHLNDLSGPTNNMSQARKDYIRYRDLSAR
jgi:hypothetical protein